MIIPNLSNHLNDKTQSTNEDLSSNTNNLNRTNQLTFQRTACNFRSLTSYHELNKHLRSCLKKLGDSVVKFLTSQPCSSSTNVLKDRENSVNGESQFLWSQRNGEKVLKGTQVAYEKIRKGALVLLSLVGLQSHQLKKSIEVHFHSWKIFLLYMWEKNFGKSIAYSCRTNFFIECHHFMKKE